MKDVLLESEIQQELATVKSHIAWWERKRLLYNLTLLGCGLIPLLLSSVFRNAPFEIIIGTIVLGIIFYGFMANLCFCFGWGIGIILWHYTKNIGWLTKFNQLLFLFGFVGAALLTLGLSLMFSYIPYSY